MRGSVKKINPGFYPASGRRGFALALVIVFLGVFFTMATFFYMYNQNQRPLLDKLDRGAVVEYMAAGLCEAIKLKIKEFPEEFREAMIQLENYQKNNPGTSVWNNLQPIPLAAAFFSEFRDPGKLKNMFKIDLVQDEFDVIFADIKRIYIGLPEKSGNVSNVEFINDIIQITVNLTYKDKANVKLTRRFETSFDFKRKFIGN